MQYEPIYKVSEAAKILKIDIHTVYDMINRKDLPSILVGKGKRIKGKDLEAFINNYPLA